MYLNCHSWFSFKYGTMSPQILLEEAIKNNVQSLALTDINNTSGILDFVRRSKRHGINGIAGIDFRDGAKQQFIGLARNNEGFRELNDFLSIYIESGEPVPPIAPRFNNCYVIYPFNHSSFILKENEFVGIRPGDLTRLNFSTWKHFMHKAVILAPVTVRNKTDFNAHRLLQAMAANTILSKIPVTGYASADEILRREEDVVKIYAQYPSIISNTKKILSDCSIDFEFGKNKNKKTFTGSQQEDRLLLHKICEDNLSYRYPNPDKNIFERLEREINVITEQGYSSYFLINWEIVSYARRKNYFYVGRGSGANSIVAYLLMITNVDPVYLDLYFERFINPFRTSPPDFDIDFSWKDRDDVITHIFETHKHTHTSLLATYSTLQSNAVVRELGKVFGLPKSEIDALQEEGMQKPGDPFVSLIMKYSKVLHEFPSHLSIHAGGILISELPIHYYTATARPPKGFPLTQFSMEEAEDVGLYKFDILSQRGLGHIKDSIDIVYKNRGVKIDIHKVSEFIEDPLIKKNLSEAKCMGCFYVESPAMRMLLKKLNVESYSGLVAASSIIRPGVASSGMMREYIQRSKNLPPAFRTPPELDKLLTETFGIMVYQEDVIKVAHFFAGLDLGEADMLRRGMSGKYRGREEFLKVRDKFLSNCMARGYSHAVTHEVWRQIESFAGYAFSKGHSASYAVESYQSLFLKTYYPLEHMVAVINNFGGFYRTEFYIHEARMRGANIHAPDINKSDYLTCIYGNDIYLGFIHMAELEEKTAELFLQEREDGFFSSLVDFMNRVVISVEQLRILIRIGAFRFTGRTKKQLLWDIHVNIGKKNKTEMAKELFEVSKNNFAFPSLHQNMRDDAFDEKEILGFILCSPYSLLKEPLSSSFNAEDMKFNNGKIIGIAGYLITTKHTRTKHGDHMMFGTFIDSKGEFFDTTHFPDTAKKFPINRSGCYMIKGKVAEEFGFFSIEVISLQHLENLPREDENSI